MGEETQAAWESKSKATKEWHKAKKRHDPDENERKSLREAMVQARQEFKDIASTAKKEAWEEFTNTVTADKALGKFWRLHRQMNSRGRVTVAKNIRDADGRSLTKEADKVQAFLKRFLEQSDKGNIELRKQAKVVADEACPTSEYQDPLSVDEVRNVIMNSKESADGPDGVRYGHLKDLSGQRL